MCSAFPSCHGYYSDVLWNLAILWKAQCTHTHICAPLNKIIIALWDWDSCSSSLAGCDAVWVIPKVSKDSSWTSWSWNKALQSFKISGTACSLTNCLIQKTWIFTLTVPGEKYGDSLSGFLHSPVSAVQYHVHALSNSMEQNRYAVPHIVWNLKVNCCVHMSPPPVPLLSQINPVHSLHLIFNTYFNILSTPVSISWSLALRFPHQNPVCISFPPPHTPTLCLTVMKLIIRACHYCTYMCYKNVTLLKINLTSLVMI